MNSKTLDASFFLLLFIVIFFPINTHAAEINWSEEKFSLYANKDNLKDIIVGLAGDERIPVEVGAEIEETVSLSYIQTTRKKVFEDLVRAYDLVWYFDGNKLYVNHLNKLVSTTIILDNIPSSTFRKHLQKLGVTDTDSKFHWKSINNKGVVYFSGPEVFVENIKRIAIALDRQYAGVRSIYKWKDNKGQVHFSSYSGGETPEYAEVIEINLDSSSIAEEIPPRVKFKEGSVFPGQSGKEFKRNQN